MHGTPATLHLEDLWIRNVTITTGLVDAYSTPTLLRLIGSGQLDAGRLVTHHFDLDEMEHAYDVFGDAANTGALKVVLSAPPADRPFCDTSSRHQPWREAPRHTPLLR